MNIAICDDDMQMLGIIEQIVFECFNGNTNLFRCEAFTSGEELTSYLKTNDKFQIYILDIGMGQMDGLQTAARIRAEDKYAVIIFATSHKDLVLQAFDVLAFHYIIKPIDRLHTKNVLLSAIRYLQEKQLIFYFKTGKKVYSINYGEIECFESNKRKLVLHSHHGEYEFYGKLSELHLTSNFVQIHTSYIINLDELHSVSRISVMMKSGREILISQKYLQSFNDTYRNLLLKRYQ